MLVGINHSVVLNVLLLSPVAVCGAAVAECRREGCLSGVCEVAVEERRLHE